MKTTTGIIAGIFLMLAAEVAPAIDWNTTEVHLQYGNLRKAFPGDGAKDTGGSTVVTFQHTSSWRYGDNYFFFDFADHSKIDDEKYGGLYSHFSLGKISGNDLRFGFIRDFGFDFSPDIHTFYYLPGIRFALDIPGFSFANLDVTAYIQDSASRSGNNITSEDNTYLLDFSWAYPFKLGKTDGSIEGHLEYAGSADTTSKGEPGKRERWILFQPQFRIDVGKIFGWRPQTIFAGVEWVYWDNKLGDKGTDENVAQALLVWRL